MGADATIALSNSSAPAVREQRPCTQSGSTPQATHHAQRLLVAGKVGARQPLPCAVDDLHRRFWQRGTSWQAHGAARRELQRLKAQRGRQLEVGACGVGTCLVSRLRTVPATWLRRASCPLTLGRLTAVQQSSAPLSFRALDALDWPRVAAAPPNTHTHTLEHSTHTHLCHFARHVLRHLAL